MGVVGSEGLQGPPLLPDLVEDVARYILTVVTYVRNRLKLFRSLLHIFGSIMFLKICTKGGGTVKSFLITLVLVSKYYTLSSVLSTFFVYTHLSRGMFRKRM